jgi:hypothetical protein
MPVVAAELDRHTGGRQLLGVAFALEEKRVVHACADGVSARYSVTG